MDEVEVFTYGWTFYNGETDSVEQRYSDAKVTMEFFEDRLKNGKFPPYQLLSDTRELVPSSAIIEGKYHPELHRKGFQRQVK